MTAPVFGLPSGSTAITENDGTTTHTLTGTAGFTDLRPGPGPYANFQALQPVVAQTPSPLGTLIASITNQALSDTDQVGAISWSYSVANSAINYLAQGETRIEIFRVAIVDADGMSSFIDLSITITGTNDVPQFTSTATPVTIGEDTHPLTASGSITFTDADTLDDDHSVSVSLAASGQLNTFSATNDPSLLALLTTVVNSESNDVAGNVNWTFNTAGSNAAFQYLQNGQTLTLVYTLTLTDDFNGAAPTTRDITITITGANDAPVLAVGSRTINDTPVDDNFAPLDGSFSRTDADLGDAPTYSVGGGTSPSSEFGYDLARVGTYGTLHLNTTSGQYRYVPNDAAIEGLNSTAQDNFSITVTDSQSGSDTRTFTVTINGVNDAAVITGQDTGAVTEAGGIANGTVNTPTATGNLDHTDVDAADADDAWNTTVVTQGAYGTLAINAQGEWTYTLNNALPAVQELDGGTTPDTLTDTVTVATADGTQRQITITITGANDAAVITGQDTGAVTEAGGIANGTVNTPTATGNLDHTDIDGNDLDDAWNTTVVTQGAYGTLAINAQGEWTYSLRNGDSNVQGLNGGQIVTDTVTVATADGTQQQITITITGANDAAVITGQDTGAVTEAGGIANATNPNPTTTGNLDHTDVDAADLDDAWNTTVVTQGAYGTLAINAQGEWTYTLNNALPAVQELDGGTTPDTLTDTVTVATADGTQRQITITITGANDAAVITGQDTGAVTEAGGIANGTVNTPTATGNLDHTDIDGNDLDDAWNTTVVTQGAYGTLAINEQGEWTYSLRNGDSNVQGLNGGQIVTDTVTVATADGTQQQITITITGANDAAVITGQDTGAVTEAGGSPTAR